MTGRVIEPGTATWLGFVLMCLGMFMAILDIQVVATSLPTIQSALAISRDAMSWIQTAYLIAEIIAIPLTGWLTRVLTLRWLFVIAISLFTLASVGCAFSGSFTTLVSFRVRSGLCRRRADSGGFFRCLPAVSGPFAPIATTMAGIMAVLAPTVGPAVGGWITETWSWHWLFLINVAPGVLTAAATPFLLPNDKPRFADLVALDGYSLVLIAISLASLEIGLKQAPHHGWLSPPCSILFLLSVVAATAFAARTLKAEHPVIELSTLKNLSFAIGCALSFCLGVGLFGSVYLMPVFLSYVRHHGAFEIGTIMLITGVSQLVAAPIVGALESRFDPRWLSQQGSACSRSDWGAVRSRAASPISTRCTGRRSCAASRSCSAYCRRRGWRWALDAGAQVPDASGLFNLMRNLGGAIGIALIDTILYGRTGGHAEALRDRLLAGDITAAQAIGLDLDLFTHRPAGVSDATVEAYVRPMVEKAAFALSTNEAWALLACAALLGLLLVPFAGPLPQSNSADAGKP